MIEKFVVAVDGIAITKKFGNETDAILYVQKLEEEKGIYPESISILKLDD